MNPHISNVFTGNTIAKPFVTQFVVMQPVVTVRPAPVLVAVGNDRLVLHAKVRRFGDHRIHYALNCASVGCPPMRAYTGDRLGDQLRG